MRTLLAGTLRRQVTLGVALVIAALMTSFVIDLTLRQRASFRERQAAVSSGLAQALATSAAGWLAARDIAGLQELVEAQQHLPQLRFAMLLDAQGQVLAHTDRARLGQYVRDLPAKAEMATLTRTADLVDVVAPVLINGTPIGWARVGIDRQFAISELTTIARNGVLYALVAIAAGSLFAALVSARLTRRLRIIQDVADAVERGEVGRRAALGGTDEAAHLARAFDQMLDSLAAARSEVTESEQRLRLALDAAAMVAWRWDIDADRIAWGEDPTHLLGPKPDQGYPDLRQLVVPEDRALYLAAGRAALERGAPYRVEFRLRRTDGEVRWLLARGRVIADASGRPVAMLGINQDITAAKQAEERLRESEARSRLVIDSAPDGMLVVDAEGRILRANSRIERMFGHSAAELVGQPVELLVPERLRERHVELRTSYLHRAVPRSMGRTMALIARRSDGSEFPATVSLSPMWLGPELQVLATVVDITERQALEAELLRHRDHLEELVAARTAELTAARVEAERLARVKSEFLANMSHEIRTPLNAILGLAQIGGRAAPGPAERSNFARIGAAGQHLLDVVSDILDFSRLDAGKLVIERNPFSLAAALTTASDFVALAAQGKGIAYHLHTAADLPEHVVGDSQRLQQILVNLLANAVKFTERGEVRLQVTKQGDEIVFCVADSGIGMTPEQLGRLFQPFEQADKSTTRRYGGSGLGLAISLNLAHLMGGQIDVESRLNEGSIFTLRLPLPAAPAAAVEPAAPAADLGSRLLGLRVLAAEDVDVNRMVLDAQLTYEGARVVFAENGQVALETLQQRGESAFDAVLMDVQMPVMDGLEAARRMHAMAPGLPIIGLTAHALDSERQKCMAAGMVAHITKPVDANELVVAILRHARRTRP